MTFTLFDMLVFSIIGLSTILGVYRGLIKMFTNLMTLLSSFVASYFIYQPISRFLSGYIANEVLCSITSGAIAFTVSILTLSLVFNKLLSFLEALRGGFMDRTFGLLLGFVRGNVVSCILFSTLAIFSTGSYVKAETVKDLIDNTKEDSYPEWLKKSFTTNYFHEIIHTAVGLFSEETLSSIKLPISQGLDKEGSIDDKQKDSGKSS